MRRLVLAVAIAGLVRSVSTADPTPEAAPPAPVAAPTSPNGSGLPASAGAGAATPPAAESRLLDDQTFAVHSSGGLLVDGGLAMGMPAALPAGMSTGVGAGITRDGSCWWSYGARASWSTATESSEAWTVSHSDYRLRGIAALGHAFGRGTLALRLGVGTTIVHEDRVRQQGMRAGLTGNALETTATAALPAADLEAVVALHLAGPWLLVVSGGPSADILDGHLRSGWIAGLGVGWQR